MTLATLCTIGAVGICSYPVYSCITIELLVFVLTLTECITGYEQIPTAQIVHKVANVMQEYTGYEQIPTAQIVHKVANDNSVLLRHNSVENKV
jgi:hypothetical protein